VFSKLGIDVFGERIMPSENEYREYAQECVQWAATAKTEKERQIFLEMANAWTRVALIHSNGARLYGLDGNGAQPPIHF
jgi:hypothetical protein